MPEPLDAPPVGPARGWDLLPPCKPFLSVAGAQSCGADYVGHFHDHHNKVTILADTPLIWGRFLGSPQGLRLSIDVPPPPDALI